MSKTNEFYIESTWLIPKKFFALDRRKKLQILSFSFNITKTEFKEFRINVDIHSKPCFSALSLPFPLAFGENTKA
jgi:hypothetical protein